MTSRMWMPALAGLCLLSACSHGGPPPPPMTAFVPGACAPAFTLQGAAVTPVVMQKEAKVSFGVTTSCMVLGDGQPTLYSVFSLPVQADTYLITVRSLPIGEGMIIPRLLLM